ncbi:MAG: hypothetical protein GEV06_16410 [Luteitalea sp.]|nr:hypothetical protein [Luteitalea sp.]
MSLTIPAIPHAGKKLGELPKFRRLDEGIARSPQDACDGQTRGTQPAEQARVLRYLARGTDYLGLETWETTTTEQKARLMASTESLMPARMEWGPMPVPPVAIPGQATP